MKVMIEYDHMRACVNFLIYNDYYDGKRYIAQPVEFVLKEQDGLKEIKPTFTIGRPHADEFMQSMAEVLDKQGIKTDKDAKIQGTLEATRYHLEDLRGLLKLKK